jgi:hypothetical protein
MRPPAPCPDLVCRGDKPPVHIKTINSCEFVRHIYFCPDCREHFTTIETDEKWFELMHDYFNEHPNICSGINKDKP